MGIFSAQSTRLQRSCDNESDGTDFEQAALSAVQEVLGSHVHVQGCFCHLTQSTWRRIQHLGLVAAYRSDDDVKHFCGMLSDCLHDYCGSPDTFQGRLTPIFTLTSASWKQMTTIWEQKKNTNNPGNWHSVCQEFFFIWIKAFNMQHTSFWLRGLLSEGGGLLSGGFGPGAYVRGGLMSVSRKIPLKNSESALWSDHHQNLIVCCSPIFFNQNSSTTSSYILYSSLFTVIGSTKQKKIEERNLAT